MVKHSFTETHQIPRSISTSDQSRRLSMLDILCAYTTCSASPRVAKRSFRVEYRHRGTRIQLNVRSLDSDGVLVHRVISHKLCDFLRVCRIDFEELLTLDLGWEVDAVACHGCGEEGVVSVEEDGEGTIQAGLGFNNMGFSLCSSLLLIAHHRCYRSMDISISGAGTGAGILKGVLSYWTGVVSQNMEG